MEQENKMETIWALKRGTPYSKMTPSFLISPPHSLCGVFPLQPPPQDSHINGFHVQPGHRGVRGSLSYPQSLIVLCILAPLVWSV